ncbi:MAG: hypothetical protein IPQ01_11970 [Zoogloea sp.]|jgi:hypothetical protein|nr:hypothetical protein [Zoogloea sp.]
MSESEHKKSVGGIGTLLFRRMAGLRVRLEIMPRVVLLWRAVAQQSRESRWDESPSRRIRQALLKFDILQCWRGFSDAALFLGAHFRYTQRVFGIAIFEVSFIEVSGP